MTEHTADQVRARVDAIYRSDSRRALATLIRLLGDFDLAEDALHDALPGVQRGVLSFIGCFVDTPQIPR